MDRGLKYLVWSFVMLIFSPAARSETEVLTVLNAMCCSAYTTSETNVIADVRCPTTTMNCDMGGCCLLTNTTSPVAEAYVPYQCYGTNVTIGAWEVCNGVPQCPMADDELYCYKYPCLMTSGNDMALPLAPCPNSDQCYEQNGSCRSIELCGVSANLASLCVDPCPSLCTCDLLGIFCSSGMYGSAGSPVDSSLLNSGLKVFGMTGFTGTLIISNSSLSSSRGTADGEVITIQPFEFPYMDAFVVGGPKTGQGRYTLVIEDGAFFSNSYLHDLEFTESGLETISSAMFEGLSSLNYLNLMDNQIRNISAGTFAHLVSLGDLTLERNKITHIVAGTFNGLQNLRSLSLAGNQIISIEPGSFHNLIRLRFVYILDATLEDFSEEIFYGLEGLISLHVTDFRLCCRVINLGECVDYEPLRFSTCSGGMLQYETLNTVMWILSFSALLGNLFVIATRVRARNRIRESEKGRIQSILIVNLAVADFLTGVYLTMLASADSYFEKDYFIYAASWREGPWCKMVGVIALLSSEVSVLILALISIDRFLGVVCPFGRFNLTVNSVKIATAVIWVSSIIISIIPPIIVSTVRNLPSFYTYSDVCLGLPLIRSTTVEADVSDYDYDTGNADVTITFVPDGYYPYYGIVVFIGLNLLCFLIILFSYIGIFVSVRRTARKAARTPEREQELRLAARMALIVVTDFCCWMPIIIMSILAQAGTITLPTQLYAWCVVFILPINSAVNPHLYTFGTTFQQRRRKQKHSSTTPNPSKNSSGETKETN